MEKSRVYIVEDSFIISLHLRKILELNGYAVVGIVDNGEQAIAEVLEVKPDLLLMDVMLNGEMDGVETVSRIKEQLDIPVIYITALTNKETIRRIKFTDPNSYLKKPFDDNEVLTIIELTLQKNRKEEETRLRQKGLEDVINNLSLMIFSIDRDFRILAANSAFVAYVEHYHGLTVRVGQRLGQEMQTGEFMGKTQAAWHKLLEDVFNGQCIKDTVVREDHALQLNIKPLFTQQQITGASFSVEDVTDSLPLENSWEDTNQELGELKLMALRSAVNPHFVFNALNSIQYFIAKGERKESLKYLNHFSKLVRSILSHSMNSAIWIQDEINLIKDYLALEQLRFEDKFTISFTIDPRIERSTIQVPPLVIQPYIENAILHGLSHKQGKGSLKVAMQLEEKELLVTIEDDGVGREAAKALEINQQESQQTSMLKSSERIQRMHSSDVVNITTEDICTPAGEAAGTRVRIRILTEVSAIA